MFEADGMALSVGLRQGFRSRMNDWRGSEGWLCRQQGLAKHERRLRWCDGDGRRYQRGGGGGGRGKHEGDGGGEGGF